VTERPRPEEPRILDHYRPFLCGPPALRVIGSLCGATSPRAKANRAGESALGDLNRRTRNWRTGTASSRAANVAIAFQLNLRRHPAPTWFTKNGTGPVRDHV